jgi:CDGSH-type Zn-finger protein
MLAMADPKHGERPIVIEETPGKKAYCQCGWAESLPYCDGSHNRMQTGCAPIVCEVPDAGKKAICQCHQSGNLPWCDGTHKRLGKS